MQLLLVICALVCGSLAHPNPEKYSPVLQVRTIQHDAPVVDDDVFDFGFDFSDEDSSEEEIIPVDDDGNVKIPVGALNDLSTRIVNGQNAVKNEYPFMVHLLSCDQSDQCSTCGASILTEKYILTAAHCVDAKNLKSVRVVAGDHDKTSSSESAHQTAYVSRITFHAWDSVKIVNDIAILELSSSLQLNSIVQPACLASGSSTYQGYTSTVMGWGATSHTGPGANILQKLNLEVLSTSECNRLGASTDEKQICVVDRTQDRNVCFGDSGGPMVVYENYQYRQVGVASYITSQCGTRNRPSVYLRVTAYRDWIQRVTGSSLTCPEAYIG